MQERIWPGLLTTASRLILVHHNTFSHKLFRSPSTDLTSKQPGGNIIKKRVCFYLLNVKRKYFYHPSFFLPFVSFPIGEEKNEAVTCDKAAGNRDCRLCRRFFDNSGGL